MRYDDAGQALGEPPNRLRYADDHWQGPDQMGRRQAADHPDGADSRDLSGRRTAGAGAPLPARVWTHDPGSFAHWAGIGPAQGRAAFDGSRAELIQARTPIGDSWLLASDEALIRSAASKPAPARLLPSGDTYYLLQGADRELLVTDPLLRAEFWTSRVWPGALLVTVRSSVRGVVRTPMSWSSRGDACPSRKRTTSMRSRPRFRYPGSKVKPESPGSAGSRR